MEIELIEIRDFLAAHHPFDVLPADVLDRLPTSLSVRYLRRGTPVPPPDADANYVYIIRQGAIEVRANRGDLVDKLGEGGMFSSPCETDGVDGSSMTSVAAEDTLVYLFPCEQLEHLRSDHPEFATLVDASRTRRLENAIKLIQESPGAGPGLLTIAVSSLVKRPPVVVAPGASIRQAAELMKSERVSSLLLLEGDRLVGLVTDRDLRNRCVATGIDSARPISEIMTEEVQTIGPASSGFEALMRMTQLNVHHLPVVDGTRVLGLISTTDLIRHESANSVYLAGDASKADSIESLAAIGRKLPELQLQLSLAGASGRHVGEAVSTVNDAITRRLLELAEQQLGVVPAPYAWITGGSHARREQTSHSDQDNALILSGGLTPEDEKYFESLARFVNDGLNACGFVYCPGDVMASNPHWRQSRSVWRRYFDAWIDEPDPMALMHSSVFFDLRVVHGDASLFETLQRENMMKSRANGIFLAHMTTNALAHRPPLGFFRNIVLVHGGEHDKTFDIKHRGIAPIVDLARVYALGEGCVEINTVDRLRAVSGTQAVSTEGARNLEDAYEIITSLRVRHQARQLGAGEKADNFVAPEALSALERSHLKDAFAVIETMQQALANRYSSAGIL